MQSHQEKTFHYNESDLLLFTSSQIKCGHATRISVLDFLLEFSQVKEPGATSVNRIPLNQIKLQEILQSRYEFA